MYCKYCGQQMDDDAAFCPNCGGANANASSTPNVNPDPAPAAGAPAANVKRSAHGIALAAKVFIILGMICGFWYILPLIFGGVALSKMSYGKPSTAMGICVLLFCNLIGGILLLCSSDKDYV